MGWGRIITYLLAFVGVAAASPDAVLRSADNAAIQASFDALYNFDFPGARRAIRQYIDTHSEDPSGYCVLASIALFQELDRLSILEGEFFRDDDRIKDDSHRPKPDPGLQKEIFGNIDRAQQLALTALKRDQNDTNALFAMVMTEGMTMNYQALIEKRQVSSLRHARSAQAYAVRTLAVDPEFYDVYCTTGLSEYVLGSIPFFMRWFIKFDDTEGNKQTGLKKLQIAASKGKYFKPYAKLLLAIFHLRQKDPATSERYLAQFEAQYPVNPLVKRERRKLAEMVTRLQASGVPAK